MGGDNQISGLNRVSIDLIITSIDSMVSLDLLTTSVDNIVSVDLITISIGLIQYQQTIQYE